MSYVSDDVLSTLLAEQEEAEVEVTSEQTESASEPVADEQEHEAETSEPVEETEETITAASIFDGETN